MIGEKGDDRDEAREISRSNIKVINPKKFRVSIGLTGKQIR
jgi:hypothetical protein